VYGRSAHVAAYVDQKATTSYSFDVTEALRFDSMQKEAVLLWPIVLTNYKYDLERNRNACLSVLNKAIVQYASDKEYVSELYNSKAVVTVQTDTAAVRKALEEGVKIFPANINAWNNLLKFYGSYDNAKGAVMVDKLIDILKKKKDNATLAVAYVYKGDFFWRQEKKEAAKKAYQEALVWDANNTTAKDRAKLQ
jgi:tetratricopeptide (TPR) repeat protein